MIRVAAQQLPRFIAAVQKVEQAQKLARILLETDAEQHPESNGRVLRHSADGHARARARGVPIVGRVGGGGASPSTDPLAALVQKEARGELRL